MEFLHLPLPDGTLIIRISDIETVESGTISSYGTKSPMVVITLRSPYGPENKRREIKIGNKDNVTMAYIESQLLIVGQ